MQYQRQLPSRQRPERPASFSANLGYDQHTHFNPQMGLPLDYIRAGDERTQIDFLIQFRHPNSLSNAVESNLASANLRSLLTFVICSHSCCFKITLPAR